MHRRRVSHRCSWSEHDLCVDGAAVACGCFCHLHPSRLRPLASVGAPLRKVRRTTTSAADREDNGAEIEGRAAGEARPPLVSFLRVLP